MARLTDYGKIACMDADTGEEIEVDPKDVLDLIPMSDDISPCTVIKTKNPERPLRQVRERPSDLAILLVKCAEGIAALVLERIIARALR